MPEIRIVADEHSAVTVDGDQVTLESGTGLTVQRKGGQTRGRKIFVPGPLKPATQLILRRYGDSGAVAPLSEDELARFAPDEALVLGLRGTNHIDVADLDAIADQADRRDVEMVVRLLADEK